MTRSTALAAVGLALLKTTVANAAEQGPRADAVFSATAASAGNTIGLPRAGRPAYRNGGWLCPPGLVWRNAGGKDWLCVEPFEAQRISKENQRASESWIEGSDGTHSCRSGLVPRDAFKNDIVCVDPLRRESVRTMNLALYSDL